ncbi:transmembrane protein 232 isoform X2 [Polypterus senegalus]|uniref:transmembrane protein 232 isoform X2 n=1 Tax=Polypterus senegalus TaxID=55291 RepID=UPI0019657F63|nr:transmembrane protein 232 isoform X2 [Polypterus senegalus]
MPIFKVPVVQSFGIVSQSHQIELQNRLLQKVQEIEESSKKKDSSQRNPIEITEEFIQQFQNAKEGSEQIYYVDLAMKMLNRCKRRAGISTLGVGEHVDLPLAWTELLLLALCRGRIQQALAGCEASYQHFPNILFVVQFILKTGKIICGLDPVYTNQGGETKLWEQCPTGSGPVNTRQPEQNKYEVSQIQWHSVLAWCCVQKNTVQLQDVLHHLLSQQDELHQENWISSLMGLMVLGDAAKRNLSCLHAFLDLSLDVFEKSSDSSQHLHVPIRRGLSAWPWQLIYVYSTTLTEICLNGCSSEIQKTALVGKRPCTQKNDLNQSGLLWLLNWKSLPNVNEEKTWYIRYSAVYCLELLCQRLQGDTTREGLRNAAWKSLQSHLSKEKDCRVLEATELVKAEISVPKTSFFNVNAKPPSSSDHSRPSQHVSWRVADMLSRLFFPPADPHLIVLIRPKKQMSPPRAPLSKQPAVKRKVTRLSLSQEILLAEAAHEPLPTFNQKTECDLMKMIDDQWKKELHITMEEEALKEKEELEEKQKNEEECLKSIMRRREEKLGKKTKPYELHFEAVTTEK